MLLLIKYLELFNLGTFNVTLENYVLQYLFNLFNSHFRSCLFHFFFSFVLFLSICYFRVYFFILIVTIYFNGSHIIEIGFSSWAPGVVVPKGYSFLISSYTFNSTSADLRVPLDLYRYVGAMRITLASDSDTPFDHYTNLDILSFHFLFIPLVCVTSYSSFLSFSPYPPFLSSLILQEVFDQLVYLVAYYTDLTYYNKTDIFMEYYQSAERNSIIVTLFVYFLFIFD